MHEQEVGRVLLLADLGSNTCCHRNGGNACCADERVDLLAGQEVHNDTDEESADCSEGESAKADDDDLNCLELEEVSA